jgi:hypothetical protein
MGVAAMSESTDKNASKLLAVVCHPRINNYSKKNLKLDWECYWQNGDQVFCAPDHSYQYGAIQLGLFFPDFYPSRGQEINERMVKFWIGKATGEKGCGWINQKAFQKAVTDLPLKRQNSADCNVLVRCSAFLHVCPVIGEVSNPKYEDFEHCSNLAYQARRAVPEEGISLTKFQHEVLPIIAQLHVLPFKYRIGRFVKSLIKEKRTKVTLRLLRRMATSAVCIPKATEWYSSAWYWQDDFQVTVHQNLIQNKLGSLFEFLRAEKSQAAETAAKALKRAEKTGRVSTAAARAWFAKQNLLSRFIGWAKSEQTTKQHA